MINKPPSLLRQAVPISRLNRAVNAAIWKIAAAISLAAVACGGGKRDEFGPPDAAIILADAQIMDGGAPDAFGNDAVTDGQAPCNKDTDSDGFCDEDPREVCKGMPDLRDEMGNPVNTDRDPWPNACDKCPTQKPANGDAYHPDEDGDGLGDDMCDLDCGKYFDPYNMDDDGDGVNNALDTCPDVPNPPISMPAQLPPDAGTLADAAILPSPDSGASITDAGPPDDASMPLTDGSVLTPDAAGQPTDGPVPIPDAGASADVIPQAPPTPYYFKRILTAKLKIKIPPADASIDSGLPANLPPPIYGGTPPDGGVPEQQNSPRICLPQNDDDDNDGFGKSCDIDDNDPTIN